MEDILHPLFFSYPLKLNDITVSESLLVEIIKAAQLGMKPDEIAYCIGLEPTEMRLLIEHNAHVKWAVSSAKAHGKRRMLEVLIANARAGDTKAAIFMAERMYEVPPPARTEEEKGVTVTVINSLPIPHVD